MEVVIVDSKQRGNEPLTAHANAGSARRPIPRHQYPTSATAVAAEIAAFHDVGQTSGET